MNEQSDTIDRERRLRLAEASRISGVSVHSLRTEAKNGRLVMWRVAGKDWTSLAEIDKMFDLCRIPAKAAAPATQGRAHQASRADEDRIAYDAAMASIRRIKSRK